jgi:hypothetical protein
MRFMLCRKEQMDHPRLLPRARASPKPSLSLRLTSLCVSGMLVREETESTVVDP